MSTQKAKTLHPAIRAIGTLLFFGYVAWTVGLSIWKNYETNQKLDELAQEISLLEDDIAQLQDVIIYYQTDSFREMEARRRLGLKGKDETVVILPKPEERKKDEAYQETIEPIVESDTRSNFSKWWDFIF